MLMPVLKINMPFYAAFRKKVNAFSIFIADGLQITKSAV